MGPTRLDSLRHGSPQPTSGICGGADILIGMEKKALVAGASRGIGLAIARELALRGRSDARGAVEEELKARCGGRLAARRCGGYIANRQIDRGSGGGGGGRRIFCVQRRGDEISASGYEEFTDEELCAGDGDQSDGLARLTQGIGKSMIARGQGGKIVNIGSLMSVAGLPYLGALRYFKVALRR